MMRPPSRDESEAIAIGALTGMKAIDMQVALDMLVRMGWFDEDIIEADVGRTRAELMAEWLGEVLCMIGRHDWQEVVLTANGRTFIAERCARCKALPRA